MKKYNKKISNITQISFVADAPLKERALERAKREGITLKALLTMSMRAYVDGKLSVGVSSNEYYNDLFEDKDIVKKANQLGSLLKKKQL